MCSLPFVSVGYLIGKQLVILLFECADYLKADGGFDEEMFCKIEESIKNGACPRCSSTLYKGNVC